MFKGYRWLKPYCLKQTGTAEAEAVLVRLDMRSRWGTAAKAILIDVYVLRARAGI